MAVSAEDREILIKERIKQKQDFLKVVEVVTKSFFFFVRAPGKECD